MRSRSAQSFGFAPIAGDEVRVLILGSLPSTRSIKCNEYYAHPQNAFWKIMAELLTAVGTYEERCLVLIQHGIGVWDVLASSIRPGSMDADIDQASAEINNFDGFLAEHPEVRRICFNGQAAARIFERRVAAGGLCEDIEMLTLPSTSPAYAAMRYAQKLELWRAGIGLTSCRN